LIVIPAKAGIQRLQNLQHLQRRWIPAFAGMTSVCRDDEREGFLRWKLPGLEAWPGSLTLLPPRGYTFLFPGKAAHGFTPTAAIRGPAA
jgi:hypothetical protein